MSLLNRRTLPGIASVALVALGLGAFAVAQTPAVHEVTIANMAFAPTPIEIAAGDTVRFTNTDHATHNVVVTGGDRSRAFRNGESIEMTFADPGTYDYICSFHRNMSGQVIVN